MASIIINFKDGSQSRADLLQISFQFEDKELNRTYLAKIGYRINGPGNTVKGPWQDLDEKVITAEKTAMMIEWKPSISPNSSFQQRVQFKVVLFETLMSTESEEFDVRQ
jgi:hypothetical protein